MRGYPHQRYQRSFPEIIKQKKTEHITKLRTQNNEKDFKNLFPGDVKVSYCKTTTFY